MEEEKIKSALEIAMERISGLPQLTPGEIAAQKEKEYRLIGESLCKKYLDGAIRSDQLPVEAGKHGGEQGPMVRRALIQSLCRSIRLEDAPTAILALTGLASFMADKTGFPEEAGKNLRQILDEFEREKVERSREFEVLAVEEIRELGISGTAVRPNLDQNETWKQELIRIQKAYEPRLANLREMLLRALGA